MKLFSELKRAVHILEPFKGQWAVCGGIAASIYRSKPRFTDDIDFALTNSEQIPAIELAKTIVSQLGYKEYIGFVPNPREPSKQVKGLLCARVEENERFIGLDFLLPSLEWVESAVSLAQHNFIDYGFASLPTLTPESLIVAKSIALTNSPDRLQDEEDIMHLLKDVKIDRNYISSELKRLNYQISERVNKLIFCA